MRASRLFTLPVALAVALALLVAVAGTAAASPTVLITDLTGAAEAPGPGDTDGSGFAVIRLDADTGKVCWTYKVRNVATITAAHIHVAPTGSPGPVVIPLSPADATSGVAVGCTSASSALVAAIVANPSAYYVNVHNADFPAGALRGQLG